MMPCSPRMTACKATCLHRARVREYEAERIRQQDTAREEANGWETEYQEALEKNPLITFKEWLIQTKNPEPPEAIAGPWPGDIEQEAQVAS